MTFAVGGGKRLKKYSWNSLAVFPIGRVIDYGDLLALFILPFSFAYGRNRPHASLPRPAVYLIACVSIFAFTATQYAPVTVGGNEYDFQCSKKELIARMSRLPSHDVEFPLDGNDTFHIAFDSCMGEAYISVGEKGDQSVIELSEMSAVCPRETNKKEVLGYFEKEFIEKLKEESVRKSSQVLYVWGMQSPKPAPKAVNRNHKASLTSVPMPAELARQAAGG